MSLVSCAPFEWPMNNEGQNSTVTTRKALVNASGEGAGCVILIPESGVIDKVSFHLTSVTNANASTQVTVSLYVISLTTGVPTTTLYDLGNGQWDKTGSGILTDNAWNTFDFTGGDGNGAATVVKGDYLGVTIEMTTLGGSDAFSVGMVDSNLNRQSWPFVIVDTGGGWADQVSSGSNVILEYASSTYVVAPELGGITFISGSSLLEQGNRFQVPFPCRISGYVVDGGTAGQDQVYSLKADATAPGGTNLAETRILDPTVNGTPANASRHMYVRFTTPFEAAKDTWYRLTSTPESGNNNPTKRLGLSNAALLQTLGTISHYFTIDDGGGGWTDTTKDYHPARIVIDQIDDGAGGGGGTDSILGQINLNGGLQ